MPFPIYYNGQILFRNGQPAFSLDCCCGDDDCPCDKFNFFITDGVLENSFGERAEQVRPVEWLGGALNNENVEVLIFQVVLPVDFFGEPIDVEIGHSPPIPNDSCKYRRFNIRAPVVHAQAQIRDFQIECKEGVHPISFNVPQLFPGAPDWQWSFLFHVTRDPIPPDWVFNIRPGT